MKRSTLLVILVVNLLLAPTTAPAGEPKDAVQSVDAGDTFRLDTPQDWVRHDWGVMSPDGAAAVLLHTSATKDVIAGIGELNERISLSRSTARFSGPLGHVTKNAASLTPKTIKVAGVDAQMIELKMQIANKNYEMSALHIPSSKGQALVLVALLDTAGASPELNKALDAVLGSVSKR